MECIILFRNPSNRSVGFISKENGELEVFKDRQEAIDLGCTHFLLKSFPFQIVELEDL